MSDIETIRTALNYLDRFRTLEPQHEDRDAALAALERLSTRLEEVERLLGDIIANDDAIAQARHVGLGIAGPEHFERREVLREQARSLVGGEEVTR